MKIQVAAPKRDGESATTSQEASKSKSDSTQEAKIKDEPKKVVEKPDQATKTGIYDASFLDQFSYLEEKVEPLKKNNKKLSTMASEVISHTF